MLENAGRLILTDVVVAELVYVLESFYRQPRKTIAVSVQSLLAHDPIAVANHDLLLRAIELYEHARLDFAEAYLAAAAELSDVESVASLHRTLDRVDTIRRVHRA